MVDKEGRQQPIYYAIHFFIRAQQRYPLIDKAPFTRRMTSRNLKHYFSTHKITTLTFYPFKNILGKSKQSDCLSQIAIKLRKFDIHYKPQSTIKAQALAKFVTKWIKSKLTVDLNTTSREVVLVEELNLDLWMVYIDRACNLIRKAWE